MEIMKQFELCYEYARGKAAYIVPDLLPKELKKEPELDEKKALQFQIKYDYLPGSIISRIMVHFKNDIVEGQQWRYGMILNNDNFGCKAKIKSDDEKQTITITVQGEDLNKRDYFAAIRHTISDINCEFQNMTVEEFVPLPGYPETLIKYRGLLGYERAGKVEYFAGELGETFSVPEMLDSVWPEIHKLLQHKELQALANAEKDVKKA